LVFGPAQRAQSPFAAQTETFRVHPEPQAGGNTVQWIDTHPGLLRRERRRYGGSTQYHPHKEETWMNFYTQQHKQYCGIDLHARAMYVYILDQTGTILVHKNLPTTPEAFLRVIAPYRTRSPRAAQPCPFGSSRTTTERR
jgi:hypothetical protein